MSNLIEEQDVKSQMFPFGAFKFTDPAADATPDLTLKTPWSWIVQAMTKTGGQSFGVKAVSGADNVIADTDPYVVYDFTTGASDRTNTLPTLTDNQGKVIITAKSDSGVGTVLVTPEGTDKIGLANSVWKINAQMQHVALLGTASCWWPLTSNFTLTPDGKTAIHCGTLHMLDESDRTAGWDINVNPTTSWVEYDLSGRVPPGTVAIYGVVQIEAFDASTIICIRDGASAEASSDRTLSFWMATAAGHAYPAILKATNGIIDIKEYSASYEATAFRFILWGYFI